MSYNFQGRRADLVDAGPTRQRAKVLSYIVILSPRPAEIELSLTHYHTTIRGVTRLKKAVPTMKVAVARADSVIVAGDAPLPGQCRDSKALLRGCFNSKTTTFTPDIILKDNSSITTPASTLPVNARQYRL